MKGRAPCLVAGVAMVVAPPTAALQGPVRLDTAHTIQVLTAAGSSAAPTEQCLLGRLILRSGDVSDWRVRARAQDAIQAGAARIPNDPLCLAALGELRFAQGTTVDAHRMIRRAEGMLRERDDPDARAERADLMYLRALWMDDWIRNFDYLVNVRTSDLGVSTPECVAYGAFCLNFLRPREFNTRLDAAPSLAGVVTAGRARINATLDSILALEPRHERAIRLRMRRSMVESDWQSLDRVAREAIAAGARQPYALFGRVVAASQSGSDSALDAAVEELLRLTPPDTVQAWDMELLGAVAAEHGDAVWRLSDPLYLTSENERRTQFYARLGMAELAFADPERRLPGRHSQPGRLVLRYGWPAHIWELPRADGAELDAVQMARVLEYVSQCREVCPDLEARLPRGGGTTAGRWTFFNYDLDMPSFIFERNLSARTYQYKVMTMTEEMDSALARNAPSTFEPAYDTMSASVIVTRFPRPERPLVEVNARFRWRDLPETMDSVNVGAFVHERIGGQLVNQGTARRAGWGRTALAASLPVVFGPLQIAVEAAVPSRNVAVQRRFTTRLDRPDGLAASDLLLGTALDATGPIDRRDDLSFTARSDSLVTSGDPLALYWEIYGLATDGSGRHRYRVALTTTEAGGGRSGGAEILRSLGNVLRLRGDQRSELSWERERNATNGYAPEAITVRLPQDRGNVLITVRVEDLVSGVTTTTERLVTVVPRLTQP